MGEKRIFLPPQLKGNDIFNFTSVMWGLKDHPDLILDFSQLRFVYPFGTLVLMSEIRSFTHERGTKSLPDLQIRGINRGSNSAHSYLAHIGFFTGANIKLLDGTPIGKGPGQAKGSSSYIPITYVNAADLLRQSEELKQERGVVKPIGHFIVKESDRLAALITQQNKSSINDPVSYCLREIIRNVFEHGEATRCAVSGQKIGDEIEIAVVDRGVGIRRSLNKKYELESDLDALKKAVLPGVSGNEIDEESEDKWANSGYGLYVLSELGKRLGEFKLCSGAASLHFAGGETNEAAHSFHGAAVQLKVTKPKGINFWEYIVGIISEGEALTGQEGRPRRASASTRMIRADSD